MSRRAAIASVLALAALAGAGPAYGHAELMRTSPRASQALDHSPGLLRLRFDEPVSVPRDGVRAIAADGLDVVAGVTSGTTAVVEAELPSRLAAGKYTVRWHVVADDGHVLHGSYRFKVRRGARAAARAHAGAATARPANGTSRATTTILLVAALGAAALALLSFGAVRRQGVRHPEARRAVRIDIALIAVGAFCALALIGVVAANQAGDEQHPAHRAAR